jgi:tryptophan halogenase
MIKSTLILGAGTSGLVSALILKSLYQKMDITIVKSSDIGIVGVGEGSTEHWSKFMQIVGISVSELIKETDATFKSGIKFVNWNGDNDYYFHSVHSVFIKENSVGINYPYLGMIADGKSHHDIVPKNIHDSVHHEPLENTVNQFHFNTMKLNDYLLKLCASRGIKMVDDIINDIILDESGNVKTLLGNNAEHSADFFIDCSVFRRVMSSKLGAKWIDCSKFLPMNSAFAFPTERKEEIPSHTLSTAMSSGWMWRIPTQERFGNGYVYCDEFITDDQAYQEAQSCFEKPIEIAKSFKFKAGYVDKFWIKNCVALGLAGSFVEPLEASSIGTSIQQAIAIASSIINYEKNDDTVAAQYNKDFENVAKNIIDFVQLHYFTKRSDSEFWKHCKHLELTDFNKETLTNFKKMGTNPNHFYKPYILFKDVNWSMVMHGLGMFDVKKINQLMTIQNNDMAYSIDDIQKEFQKFIGKQTFYNHRQCLEILKEKSSSKIISFE